MRIEYLAGNEPYVEDVTAPDLHRWASEHPQAVILHAVPDGPDDEDEGSSSG